MRYAQRLTGDRRKPGEDSELLNIDAQRSRMRPAFLSFECWQILRTRRAGDKSAEYTHEIRVITGIA